MFTLARFSRLAILLALASTIASTQGCAADAEQETPGEEGTGAIATSRSEDRIADIPFYFSVPKAAITTPLNRPEYPYPTVWNPSTEVPDAGLRMIVIHQGGQGVAQKKAARIDMARRLARAGVLQDGDVALSFRPELGGTMAYPHIQMGVTHASLVYTQGGEAFNIDSPLDSEYVGQFSTLHFTGGVNASGNREYGTDALQIVRPKNMDEAHKANLRTWVATLKSNLGRINGERAQVKFQSDYLTPIFAAKQLTTQQTVTRLGQIILEQDTTTSLPMYCSEFAWHMIALSGCTQEEIRSAPAEGASCVAPVFEPMPLVATTQGEIGLAEGPLQDILVAPRGERAGLIEEAFQTGTAEALRRLSSGHRAVAQQVAPLMSSDDPNHPMLEQYYGFKAGTTDADEAKVTRTAMELNAGVHDIGNYSPTAYIANATLPAGVRSMDYVATVVFVDAQADMDKARRLARRPVP
jgi:hypothetical protein